MKESTSPNEILLAANVARACAVDVRGAVELGRADSGDPGFTGSALSHLALAVEKLADAVAALAAEEHDS
jgi:hypothetical protein